MEEFRKLGLNDKILKVIEEYKFEKPSDIQVKTIPLVLEGKDVIGGSATGSGKTLAFGAGIIEHAHKGKGIQALVLVPTRELAEQVCNSLTRFSKYYDLNITDVYGGVGIEPQIHALRDAEIVVGTPGRILDHIERRTINLSNVKTLVLDEADRMLDMGFIDDVESIIKECKGRKQTLLFSATIGPDIEHMSKKYMNNPINISVESYVDASKLKQEYYDVPQNIKFSLLVHFLKQEKSGLVMVFCNTRMNSDFVASNLKRYGLYALAIHGGLTQARRNNIMEKFKAGEVYILVCTDVAARGLDIKNVSHVYNYDIPKTSDEYIHRVGRTARAGKEGIAVSIVSQRDYENFRHVLEDHDIKIEHKEIPQNIEQVYIKFDKPRRFGRDSERGYGGRGGGRGYAGRGRSYGRR